MYRSQRHWWGMFSRPPESRGRPPFGGPALDHSYCLASCVSWLFVLLFAIMQCNEEPTAPKAKPERWCYGYGSIFCIQWVAKTARQIEANAIQCPRTRSLLSPIILSPTQEPEPVESELANREISVQFNWGCNTRIMWYDTQGRSSHHPSQHFHNPHLLFGFGLWTVNDMRVVVRYDTKNCVALLSKVQMWFFVDQGFAVTLWVMDRYVDTDTKNRQSIVHSFVIIWYS